MGIDRKLLKRETKLRFRENGFKVYLVATIFVVTTVVLSLLVTKLSGYTEYYTRVLNIYDNVIAERSLAELTEAQISEYQQQMTNVKWPQVTAVAALLGVAVYVMLVMVDVGFQGYCLKVSRKKPANFKSMFESFNYFGKVLGISILTRLIVTIGIVLFIAPGIILLYSYRQAIFIMYDEPELGVIACMKKSRRIMSGRKMELFVLDLSFIGWALLSSFFSLSGLPVVDIWVKPYMGVTYANYFNRITGYAPEQEKTEEMPPV